MGDCCLRMTLSVRYGKLLTLWQSSVDSDVNVGQLSTLWKIICWLDNTRGLRLWRYLWFVWQNLSPWIPTNWQILCRDCLCQQWSLEWKRYSFDCLNTFSSIWVIMPQKQPQVLRNVSVVNIWELSLFIPWTLFASSLCWMTQGIISFRSYGIDSVQHSVFWFNTNS